MNYSIINNESSNGIIFYFPYFSVWSDLIPREYDSVFKFLKSSTPYHPNEFISDGEECQIKKRQNSFANMQKIFDSLPYSDSVKSEAITVFTEMNLLKNVRKKKRKGLVYFCIKEAFERLDINIAPTKLCEDIGLKPKDISPAVSKNFSKFSDGYHGNGAYIEPTNLIKYYCGPKQLSLEDQLVELMCEEWKKFDQNGKTKINGQISTIVASFIWYQLKLYGIQENENIYASRFNLKPGTIKNKSNQISKIDENLLQEIEKINGGDLQSI